MIMQRLDYLRKVFTCSSGQVLQVFNLETRASYEKIFDKMTVLTDGFSCQAKSCFSSLKLMDFHNALCSKTKGLDLPELFVEDSAHLLVAKGIAGHGVLP